jgi:hypothetical protein
MSRSVLDLLKEIGPSLSTELIEALVRAGASPAAARQRVARAGPEVKKLAGLRFPHNTRFIYLPDQFGDRAYWNAMERAFKTQGLAYWGAVTGLRSRGGLWPSRFFAGMCGCALARQRQLSPDRVWERLHAIQMLEEITDEMTSERFVTFKPHFYRRDQMQQTRAALIAENVALHGMREWCRRIGFGSFEQVRVRGDDEPPIVAGVTWDLSAPSYMRPLARAANGGLKPGFVVCDVNLRGRLDEDAVGLFVRKHDLASAPVNVAPIMPFLLADGFSEKAFGLARQKGMLATTTAQLFGEDVAKALRDLIGLLTDTGATASINPEHLEKVMSSLTRIEGAANNLRGALFELVIGTLLKDVEGGFLRAGEKWIDHETGRKAEVDVLLDRPDGQSVLIVECKSKTPGSRISLAEAQKWRRDRVPLIHKVLRNDSRFGNRPLTFELWTNGPFDEDVRGWLTSQPTHPDYETTFRDGEFIKRYVDKARTPSIRKIMNEHYFRHPLARGGRIASERDGSL